MKRLGLALGAVLLTHSSDAFAESRWEKLEEGFNVVRECAGDVVQHCKGVLPGEGRIKACMKEHLAELSTTCLGALAGPEPKALSDGANAKPKRIENTHLLRYIEIFLAGLKPDTGNIVASCYGTYANPDIPATKDTAPQALVEGLDMDKIKAAPAGAAPLQRELESLA